MTRKMRLKVDQALVFIALQPWKFARGAEV